VTASVVLINPARIANVPLLRRSILRSLSAAGWPEPTWLQTTLNDPGEAGTRSAIATGAQVVFVCGGDGTVSAAAAAVAGTDATLVVIPSGTGNVLALNLGLPSDVTSAVRVAVDGRRRLIDLGEAEGRTFTVAAGIGLDAQMLADTPRLAKHRLGWPAYGAAVIRRLGEPGFLARISLDGGPAIDREVRSVLIANVGRLPGGITLIPGASPDDGLLDVALIAPRRLLDWVSLLVSLAGRHPRGGRMETFQARRVEVYTDRMQPREMDGEPLPKGCALSVQVRPGVLPIYVPIVDNRRTRGTVDP
jgi:diacylglycerol kinase family enzyme